MFKARGLCILVINASRKPWFLLFTSGHSVCFLNFHWPFPEEYHWKLIGKCTIAKSLLFFHSWQLFFHWKLKSFINKDYKLFIICCQSFEGNVQFVPDKLYICVIFETFIVAGFLCCALSSKGFLTRAKYRL